MLYEKEFGYTLKRDTDLASLIRKGRPYPEITKELAAIVTAHEYTAPVILRQDETWVLPGGAFRKCGGST